MRAARKTLTMVRARGGNDPAWSKTKEDVFSPSAKVSLMRPARVCSSAAACWLVTPGRRRAMTCNQCALRSVGDCASGVMETMVSRGIQNCAFRI